MPNGSNIDVMQSNYVMVLPADGQLRSGSLTYGPTRRAGFTPLPPGSPSTVSAKTYPIEIPTVSTLEAGLRCGLCGHHNMAARVYVGGLSEGITERELEEEVRPHRSFVAAYCNRFAGVPGLPADPLGFGAVCALWNFTQRVGSTETPWLW